MPNVIVTGGPGAGKTTLLHELSRMGHRVVPESARAVIAERKARGASPRPDPLNFAREILRRDIERYVQRTPGSGWVFFDRGIIDALGLMHEAAALDPQDLASILTAYPFHRTALVLPPWEAIYTTDAERDQSFSESVAIHGRIVRWYRRCGYATLEVPRLPPRDRASHVIAALGART